MEFWTSNKNMSGSDGHISQKTKVPFLERGYPLAVASPSMQWLLFFAVLALLWQSSLMLPPAEAQARPRKQQSPHTASPAVHILERALLAPQHLTFTGQQTVMTFTEGDGAAVVTQEQHLGSQYHRIQYQNPPDARGRIATANGKWQLLYLPALKTLVKTPLAPQFVTPTEAMTQIKHILHSYKLHLMPNTEQMQGRPAYQLHILPRLKDRGSQYLWIDKETGLVIRRESYSPSGSQTAITHWRNLNFAAHLTPKSLQWSPPPHTKVEQNFPKEIFDFQKAHASIQKWTELPSYLGKGFYFQSARPVSSKGVAGLECQYSDGLSTLSLIQFHGSRVLTPPTAPEQEPKAVSVGKIPAQLAKRGSLLVLTWEEKKRPLTLSLIAELTQETMLNLALALSPSSPR